MTNSVVSPRENLEKIFHTLSGDNAFLLLSFKVSGVVTDLSSLHAFSALDTLLFDGESSRLHRALISGDKDLGVHSVGGFAQLDSNFGEYHVVIEGCAHQLKANLKKIKECMKEALELDLSGLEDPQKKLSPSELKRCTSAVKFHQANQRINISSTVQGWIDDYKLTNNLDNFWGNVNNWEASLPGRMDEIHTSLTRDLDPQIAGPRNLFTLLYTACSPEESALKQMTLASARDRATKTLGDPNHRRDLVKHGLEGPAAFSKFQDTFANITCKAPYKPFASQKGVWAHVSSPMYQLVKVAIRPRQYARMERLGDNVELGYLVDVMRSAFVETTDTLVQEGIRGAFSPEMAVVASYTAGKSHAFRKWVDTYASQLSKENQEALIKTYTKRKNFYQKKWNSANMSRRMNSDALVSDYIAQKCSDNYFMNENGFSDSFDMCEKLALRFNIQDAIDKWNEYWGDTTQLVSQSSPSVCKFDKPGVRRVEMTKPRLLTKKQSTQNGFQVIRANPNMELNQSIVTIARPGTMTTSTLDYWTVRPLAQIILYASLGSRLYKLREEKGMFYNASGAFSIDASAQCNGYDMIQAKVNPGVEKEMASVLQMWSKKEMMVPITEAELIMAKRILINKWRTMNTERSITANWAAHSNCFTNFTEAPQTIIGSLHNATAAEVTAYIKSDPSTFSVSFACK